jgi:hypothetical protein
LSRESARTGYEVGGAAATSMIAGTGIIMLGFGMLGLVAM